MYQYVCKHAREFYRNLQKIEENELKKIKLKLLNNFGADKQWL